MAFQKFRSESIKYFTTRIEARQEQEQQLAVAVSEKLVEKLVEMIDEKQDDNRRMSSSQCKSSDYIDSLTTIHRSTVDSNSPNRFRRLQQAYDSLYQAQY
jgi:hypothetical protein